MNQKADRFVKNPRTVVPGLIRHPEHIGITGFPLPDQVEDKLRGNDENS